MYDIGSPPPPKRVTRSRSATRRPPALPRKIAWTTGMVEDEARIPDSDPLPPQIIARPQGRARKREESTETIRYASNEPPKVRGRPKAKAQAKPKPPEQLAITNGEPPGPPAPPPAPRAKAKAKAAPQPIFRSPSVGPGAESEVFLPTTENAEKMGASLPKVIKTQVKEKASKPAPQARGRPRKTPEATSARKPVIKFVRIASGQPKEAGVKPRGRPKGAFGKARRDRMEREALESSSLA